MAEIVVRAPAQLGAIFRAFRKTRGLTQMQLAHQLGVTRQAISALERRPEVATFERLMRVWGALGVELVLRDPPPRAAAEW